MGNSDNSGVIPAHRPIYADPNADRMYVTDPETGEPVPIIDPASGKPMRKSPLFTDPDTGYVCALDMHSGKAMPLTDPLSSAPLTGGMSGGDAEPPSESNLPDMEFDEQALAAADAVSGEAGVATASNKIDTASGESETEVTTGESEAEAEVTHHEARDYSYPDEGTAEPDATPGEAEVSATPNGSEVEPGVGAATDEADADTVFANVGDSKASITPTVDFSDEDPHARSGLRWEDLILEETVEIVPAYVPPVELPTHDLPPRHADVFDALKADTAQSVASPADIAQMQAEIERLTAQLQMQSRRFALVAVIVAAALIALAVVAGVFLS